MTNTAQTGKIQNSLGNLKGHNPEDVLKIHFPEEDMAAMTSVPEETFQTSLNRCSVAETETQAEAA
jgi:hypothetical protein